jgi:N-acetylmuramoyl-L-alanine amidase
MDAVLEGDKGTLAEGTVVNGGTYHQYNTNTVRISLDLKNKAGFTSQVGNNSILLTIAEGLANETTTSTTATTTSTGTSVGGEVRYDSDKGLILPGAASYINTSAIIQNDNYTQLNYVLTMNGNFTSLIGNNTIAVNDGRIKTIDITSDGSKSVIKFNESQVMAFNITSENGDIYIKPVLPKEKYGKIVVLDAGHGGTDVGASYNSSIYEKDINLAILNKARALFDASDIKCYATRTTDVYPSFDDRTTLADVGDMFISIHQNSAGTNTSASGTETFCQYPNNLGNGLTSYIVAERVLNKLLANLGTVNRTVKSNDLKVLRDSHVPATLIEVGFITNASDRAITTSEDGQNKAAQAIFDAVNELFNEYTPVR